MTDHTELRKLAEAAPGWIATAYDANEGIFPPNPLWCISNEAFHNPQVGDDLEVAVRIIVDCGTREVAEFIASCGPAQVIALLDEIDSLSGSFRLLEWDFRGAKQNLENRDAELAQLRAELEQCKGLLRRSSNHIQSWWKQYGSEGLPPAHGVQLVEEIDAALSTETEEKKS